jgi:hypothetical protein
MIDTRGVIQNRPRRQQILDFRHVRYGNITPTDLDAMIEYKNTGYVLIEIKHEQDFYSDKEQGQLKAHERMVDALWVANKPSVLIFAKHHIKNTANDVDLAACQVTHYRYCGKWHKWNGQAVKQVVDSFIKHLDDLIQARQMQFSKT